ncbi:hypothetical protein [Pontibacter chitinilyticus]|uniref:hypothetical protein n=1 Tax=Pontibacter chitinilyticus TaxID=2674989 RepID=UPI00321A2F62
MSALDDLKHTWSGSQRALPPAAPFDTESFNQLILSSMKKQNNRIFRYFWATFSLHILVYALLSHVLIRYAGDKETLVLSLIGLLVTVPFTFVMLRRYKQMAVAKMNPQSMTSLYTSIATQRSRLAAFYKFKKRYECLLIPLLSAIGVLLVFNLYFPGGVRAFPSGAFITYLLTLLSCLLAIRSENSKYFSQPLQEMQAILDDYKR